MDALLLQELPGKGSMGDTIRVKAVYLRNYLQPRGIAVAATVDSQRLLAERKQSLLKKAAKEMHDAEAMSAVFEEITLTFSLRAGEDDRLFGSVTNSDIAKALAEKGYEVDRRKIVLDEPIRTLGMYTVHVNLQPEVEAKVKVLVEKQ